MEKITVYVSGCGSSKTKPSYANPQDPFLTSTGWDGVTVPFSWVENPKEWGTNWIDIFEMSLSDYLQED